MEYTLDDYDEFEDIATSFGPLLGQWRGTELIHKTRMSPQEVTVDSTVHYRLAVSNLMVIGDTIMRMNGASIFETHGVVQVTPDGMFEMHSFDSSNQPHDVFECGFIEGVLIMECENAGGRWRVEQRIVDGALKTRAAFWDEGGWVTHALGTYTREA
jgi:hypothetical protein